MEVQVWGGRVAGVTEPTDQLPGADSVTGMHRQASRLQVCVDGEATGRDLVRLAVVDGDHGPGCDGQHVLAVSRITRELSDGTGEQPSLRVELDEVDGEPFGGDEPAVHRDDAGAVGVGGVAAAVDGHPAAPAQRS